MSRTDYGSVASIWRYPVKSMKGEELVSVDVTERGLHGDRVYALVDQVTGKIASAKNPRKWARLFEFQAILDTSVPADSPPPVRITLPDGETITSGQEDADRVLSHALGCQVTLETVAPEAPCLEEYWPDIDGLPHRNMTTDEDMPSGTFFDGAVIHVMTTATLDHLQHLYPEGRFDVRRFRPNLVVEPRSGERGFVEDRWLGRTVAIGDEVRLYMARPCPRCVMTTLPQGDLPKDPGILRATARHNRLNAGVYASVLQGGTIRHSDTVHLE